MPTNANQPPGSQPVPADAIPEIVIAPSQTGGLSSADGSRAERAASALPALGKALAGPVTDFWQNLTQNAALRPDEIEIKLGLSFEGGSKWAIVAIGGATVDVTLTWTSESSKR